MKKLLTVLAGTIFLFLSCTDTTIKEKKPWPYKLTYLKGEVWINEKHATIDSTVQESDTVTTKKNSYVVIQFNDFATLSLKPNTRVYINLLAQGKSEIFQESGKTFSKVKSGSMYSIKTPTIVAGVRGTQFEITTTSYASTIFLLEGKVEASTKTETINIESGQKLSSKVGAKIQKSEMTQKEVDSLKVVSGFVSEAKIGEPETVKTLEKIETNDNPPIVKPAKKVMTLEQIKKTYGKIVQVICKNGAVYKGYFVQKGEYMQIITPSGTVVVAVSQVVKVLPIQ